MSLKLTNARELQSPFQGIPSLKEEGYLFPFRKYIGFAGSFRSVPLLSFLRNEPLFLHYISNVDGDIHLFQIKNDVVSLEGKRIPKEIEDVILSALKSLDSYGGYLDDDGSLHLDLKSGEVGPHYGVNLLLGDRSNVADCLLSTPKSVFDPFARGSFRGPAGYQILASRWDVLPEENGNPFNRQFYLIENGEIIFYSASISKNVEKAECVHSVNKTTILYLLEDGLQIKRTFFLPSYKEGEPEAIEIQTVSLLSPTDRNIEICFTGMFGFSNPSCMENDVIYQTVIQESSIIRNERNEIVAYSPHYYPHYFSNKRRFFGFRDEDSFPTSFSNDAASFLGNGNIENPQGIYHLDNALRKKGASFFALKKAISLKKSKEKYLYSYTGLVDLENEEDFLSKLEKFLEDKKDISSIKEALLEREDSFRRYASSFVISSQDKKYDSLVSKNLPFQNLYQSFVSRSFAQTQKGYREIGFREIQDLYGSIPYFVANGQKDLAKSLLSNWIKNVYSFGYANHNFYYEGKEPGQCSDDSLWLLLAVSEYIHASNDFGILNEEFPVAEGNKTRKLRDTLKAIVMYSGCISIGRHGLPLLDSADWNDCLKIDTSVLRGPEKEKEYQKQLEEGIIRHGEALVSDYSESVMNAFLLLTGICSLLSINAFEENETCFYQRIKTRLERNIRKHAWINDFYARVLLNSNRGISSFVGSLGDGLSENPELNNGTLYLNSFSWSILSGIASEKEIAKMLPLVDRYLRTDVGYRLTTEGDLTLLGSKDSATSHYFPGDRENGGVFKHAAMMFVESLFVGAKRVSSESLKERMLDDAFFMMRKTYPYEDIEDPYIKKGNPRFCCQYANPFTKEDMGPILSGTATWLLLAIKESMGIPFLSDKKKMLPLLEKEIGELSYIYSTYQAKYSVHLHKEIGKYATHVYKFRIDGKETSNFNFDESLQGEHVLDVYLK